MADPTGVTGTPGVRAAVVGPFSGPRAAWGELLERGAAAHAEVHWDLHDDRGEATAARSVAEAVVADGRYALVVGHFNSAGARAALPVYRAAGLPVLLPLATAPKLLAGTAGEALRWCPDDLAQLAALREEIRWAGHTHLAVADDGSTYGAVLAQLLLVLPEDTLRVTAAEPGSAITATALVVCGTHAGAAREARARRKAGFEGALYFTDDCAVDEFAELLGDVAGEAFVARLHGGAAAQVDSAFAAAAGALASAPSHAGPDVLAALRAHPGRSFTAEGEPVLGPSGAGWEVTPVAAPGVPDTEAALAVPAVPAVPAVSAEEHRGKAYDVLVIGAGVVGAATADVLARQGLRVGMTAPSAADPAATTHSGGLVRAFDADPVLRGLALRSHDLSWGLTDGGPIPNGHRRTGSLVLLGDADLPEAEKGIAELTGEGVEAVLLTPGELRTRFPGMASHDVAGAVWEPAGGYAEPATAARGYRDRACAHGAVVLPGRVRRIEREGTDLVRIVLEQGEITARAVVLAAGPGTPGIRGHRLSAGVPADLSGENERAWRSLEPLPGTGTGTGTSAAAEAVAAPRTKRIRYAFFRHAGSQGLPAVADLVTGVWGRPQLTGPAAGGYLVGRPVDEWDVPSGGGDAITPEQAEHIREGAAHRWPWLAEAEFLSGRHGVDLYTRDGRPFLGRQSPDSRIVLAAGWSGSGFKTAPAAAEQVAAHVLDALGRETPGPQAPGSDGLA
ncbi:MULTISPECIES: FAD-dependent oxidoreductase [unclassified Streptomyces]|uniref:FAD-dependent oxidoreductase n=1 Tax=unclassified Streptomyces TaxID=2593676 RepID=UPI001BE68D15|nr:MULTISPECIES: FAD-dependent oxidoreductase [unclassified Streptomyces]MBT2406355.1 FAD-dependent oxidoreductase [Streptomyces sp. ISL-21]MBT2607549.1 FAD-dependent oxidoreductase [Streptomyces sp. ISL-87]